MSPAAEGSDPAQTFREEAAELLVQIEDSLLGLEQAPDDRELLGSTFRALHTLKGSGAMFGFEACAGFVHGLETALEGVRAGRVAVSGPLIAAALEAKDHIRALIEAPEAQAPATGEALRARITALCAGAALQTAAPPQTPPRPQATGPAHGKDDAPRTWHIRFRLPTDSLSRGTNPLLLLDELREMGPCTVVALTEAVPPLAEIDPFGCYLAWDVVLTTAAPRQTVEDVFIFVIDEAELAIDPVGDEPARVGEILLRRGEVAPAAIEAAAARQHRLGDLLVADGAVSEDRLHAALAEQRHVQAEAAKAQPSPAGSVRVPAERLDGLMDQVGELVIAQSRLRQLIAHADDPQIKAVAEEIERLANGLRDTTMGIRMVPIATLFSRFRRLVHDLSLELGKDVRLSMSGEETELDKTMIERLADPLVHMIRNSLDHGLEAPQTRQAAGKPAQGRIHLSAGHSGGQILIRIQDDGQGLDRARIRAKAEQNGLIAPDTRLADAELLQLIFRPGFSTARAVTSVSGRGVGMDVVKRAIESLRGGIEVASPPGQGTEITLRLPLTLAIIDGLLVRVGEGRYIIPLLTVESCVELPEAEARRPQGRNFLNIRDSLVPYLRLREIFAAKGAPDPFQKVVVVTHAERRVGLVVDQIIGDHQTVIKSLSKLHADLASFAGAAILGDGTVALILDVAHLVERAQAPRAPDYAANEAPEPRRLAG